MLSKIESLSEKLTKWIGSIQSLVFHTLIFTFAGLAGFLGADWNKVLLVLTTVVSLEAIYLSIFIQMTVNKNTQSLKEVEADIDEIQEDVDEIQEDIDEIQEDVDEIQEDVDEIQGGVGTKSQQEQALAAIRDELSHLMISIEKLSQMKPPAASNKKTRSIKEKITDILLKRH